MAARLRGEPEGIPEAIDDTGLTCLGFHMPLTGLTLETERFIDIAHTIGAPLMIPPWIPPEERDTGPDGWKRLGEALAKGSDKARAAGLKVAWHNHAFEYQALADGSRPIDILFAAAGDLVGFEIDCGWGGARRGRSCGGARTLCRPHRCDPAQGHGAIRHGRG